MSHIPQDDKRRKGAPMFRGLLGYFPAALFEVAEHSMVSDLKHNPEGHNGEPGPFWARSKSSDHEDCIVRHLIDAGKRGTPNRRYHLRALAWRALALLQEECEAEGATPGVRSKDPDDETTKRRLERRVELLQLMHPAQILAAEAAERESNHDHEADSH